MKIIHRLIDQRWLTNSVDFLLLKRIEKQKVTEKIDGWLPPYLWARILFEVFPTRIYWNSMLAFAPKIPIMRQLMVFYCIYYVHIGIDPWIACSISNALKTSLITCIEISRYQTFQIDCWLHLRFTPMGFIIELLAFEHREKCMHRLRQSECIHTHLHA